jgi:hypothetical protein
MRAVTRLYAATATLNVRRDYSRRFFVPIAGLRLRRYFRSQLPRRYRPARLFRQSHLRARSKLLPEWTRRCEPFNQVRQAGETSYVFRSEATVQRRKLWAFNHATLKVTIQGFAPGLPATDSRLQL